MKLSNEFERTFQDLPKDLREPLGQTFSEIKHNFTLGKHEPSELNGGKFAEVVLRILEWHTSPTKQFTAFGARIPDFGQATRRFEGLSGLPDSVRFHIPKLIGAIYTLRNKRGVGHVGGDINPNHMDASLISAMASWIMAELVRLFHKIDLHEAQSIVDSLMDKSISVIWEVGDKRRVIKNGMSYKDKTLVLLYSAFPKSIPTKEIFGWCEHSNLSVYRRDVLRNLHDKKLIEYDRSVETALISPAGIRHVEENIDLVF